MEQTSKKIVIDGTNATLGRVGSYAAKEALLGKEVVVINANEVIIIGNKKNIQEKYKTLISKGGASLKGPKIIKTPERILKRAIRGMLNHKVGRGKEAFSKIRCYNETPDKYEDEKKIKAGKKKQGKYISLKDLVKLI